MSDVKLTRAVVVANSQGLHARPANLIMKLANQYESRIELVKGNERVDGKSILEILTLGAEPGTNLIIEAAGPDAEAALEALAELFASKFADGEEENT
ncbi:MAG TPA: HPr family phosphocarrier protein [Pirellulales bacterium]|jgi:phosphotransferase system HPr (HPr) family protein|nr:HPr family phosphocarrier protein [Pirellulales bacterium]